MLKRAPRDDVKGLVAGTLRLNAKGQVTATLRLNVNGSCYGDIET